MGYQKKLKKLKWDLWRQKAPIRFSSEKGKCSHVCRKVLKTWFPQFKFSS